MHNNNSANYRTEQKDIVHWDGKLRIAKEGFQLENRGESKARIRKGKTIYKGNTSQS